MILVQKVHFEFKPSLEFMIESLFTYLHCIFLLIIHKHFAFRYFNNSIVRFIKKTCFEYY